MLWRVEAGNSLNKCRICWHMNGNGEYKQTFWHRHRASRGRNCSPLAEVAIDLSFLKKVGGGFQGACVSQAYAPIIADIPS